MPAKPLGPDEQGGWGSIRQVLRRLGAIGGRSSELVRSAG
jgi:hypothetical protein